MRKKKKPIRSRATRDLLSGLAELEQIVREGLTLEDLKKRFPTRVRVVAPEPGRYTPAAIRALRAKFNVGQSGFAHLVGVSTILVQGWEQGVREPSPLARRLLDTISDDPTAWLAGLRRRNENRRVG